MGEPTKYTNRRKQLLHQLVEAVFNGQELNQFCGEHFPAVSQRFTPDMQNGARIELLIEYCAHRGWLGKLVARIQQSKPQAYQAFVEGVQKSDQSSAPNQAGPSPEAAPLIAHQRGTIVRNPEELLNQSLAGRYQIQQILDRGGVGVVFKAYDTWLELDVAIKIIDLKQVKLPAMRERVRQEVRTAMRLDHPGIVQVYDFGQADSLLYIIMEFIPGHNLRQAREYFNSLDKRIALPQILHLVCQICLTVDYMHQQRVLHPGTKPENIMLKPSQTNADTAWQPVLINLGLLRPHRETLMSQPNISMRRLTYTVSPELLLGHATDIRSDVYALGVVLYDLVVGQPPFQPRDLAEAIRFHVEEPPPRPHLINPNIPEPLEQIILKSLAKDPSERYLSAKGMAQALANYLETPSLPAPPSGVTVAMEAGPLVVVPGESLTTKIALHNTGLQANHCQIKVAGIPAGWVSISPSTITVPPGEQKAVELTIQPPRSPGSRSGRHSLTVQAVNQQQPAQIAEVKKVLTIAPYIQFESSLWPQDISTDQVAQVTVENQGNTLETFVVEPKRDQSLSFKPDQRIPLKLAPGERQTVDFHIAPRRRHWVAYTITQTFSVRVIAPDGQIVTHSGQVTSHGSVTPGWLQAAILAIALVLCVVASFYPIINPPPEAATATAVGVIGAAINQQATRDKATAQVFENQTATVMAATAQVVQAETATAQAATATAIWQTGDDDHDGLTNGLEIEIGTNPNNQDTDGDGLFDGAELDEFESDPFNRDTDFDGVPDGEEVRLNLHPRNRDTDGDGVPDSVDDDPGRVPTPTATITPNPTARVPVVRFDNNIYQVDERGQTAVINVILDRPTGSEVSVQYTTRNNTATGGDDYTRTSGTLVFDPNQTVQRFTVFIINDDLSEPDETVLLRLENPRGASLGFNSEALLAILDDDNATGPNNQTIRIRFSQPAPFLFGQPRYEVNESQSRAIIEVVLSGPASWPISVDYTTRDNTATSDDYVHTNGSLTFNPGEVRKTFEVAITPDTTPEDDEFVDLILNNAVGAVIETGRGQLVIRDND